MLVGAHSEVLDGFPGSPLSSQKDGVCAGGRTESELVESQDLTASVENALLRTTGESEGSDRQLGDLLQPNIVGDGSNLNNNFIRKIRC